MHYRDIRTVGDELSARQPIKPNVFMYGPRGSGKSWIVESFVKRMEVPVAFFDAASLVRDPRSFRMALRRLMESAGNNERRAQLGVVCLHAMEGLAGADDSIQHELAGLVEAERFELPVSEVYVDHSTYSIHTGDLFV